ncbi:ankyrin [Ophiobolus disseminans]|uniref:Ankyrin n=1 Tax=Ophiobolus disseminans TaxID=1469910 RepID=A0A6A7A9K0_9PLEO|nr:ankyrin [Ophiobolus disseminans]
MNPDLELQAITRKTTDSSSFERGFHRRERAARRREFQSSDAPNQPASTNASNDPPDDSTLEDLPLLLCLQLVAHHDVPVFSVRRGRKWNTRETLGRGSTFAVEQADLPVREAISDLQYYDIAKGRRDGCFTDHTGIKWSYDTVVAYKSLEARGRRNRENLFVDLLKELRILCHPPLQRHPNIASFIGLAWIREEDMATGSQTPDTVSSESREWPILITEKAELGTLGEFVHFRAYCQKRISLLAKARLVSDVLEAILDLHSCGIIHGDVKSNNVLVYTTATGTAENWTAKVIDFSHSVVHAQDSSTMTRREQLPGTDLYRPPELTKPGTTFRGDIADRVDVWCLGMLLWEVLLDGTLNVTQEHMQRLRNSGSVATYAHDRCKTHLESHHRDEHGLVSVVLNILDETLSEDPLLRQTAATLVPQFRALAQHDNLDKRPDWKFYKAAPLRDLPFFDANLLYVPRQVFGQLTAAHSSERVRNAGEIEFQLGLCHAVGFGVDRNYTKAVELLSKSSAHGFWKARIVLRRAAAAFATPLSPEVESLSLEWNRAAGGALDAEASRQLLVLSPLRGLGSGTKGYPLVRSQGIERLRTGPENDELLVENIKLDKFEDVEKLVREGADVNFQLDAGETALHFAILMPGTRFTTSLLQGGADALLCTTADCEIGTSQFRHQIPSNVSPLALTVLLDRVDLLQILLQHNDRTENDSKRKATIIDLLAWGAQYQSVSCTEYLCEQHLADPGRPYDYLGVNPLSYAVRADFLFRIVLFTSGIKHTDSNISPVNERQHTIVQLLLKAGFPLQVDEETGLNCLHIAAAMSEVGLLKLLLESMSDPKELEAVSPDGFSPLGIAITRGQEGAFWALILAGANLSHAWPEIRGHALHCCALYPSAASITIATKILKSHPRAVNAQEKSWRTPLHCAAFREHTEMIELLINTHANTSARDFQGYTPLGAAVSGRSIRAIRQICTALDRKRQPHVSWVFGDPFFETGWLTYSPLEQLLGPGTISPAREPEMRLESSRLETFGCCDFPFSQTSLQVLSVLVECYKHRTRPGTNFFEHMFFAKELYCGIHTAIAMGNIGAVKLILESKKWKHNYRYLVLDAHNQRMVGASHIADEATREDMLKYLEVCLDEDFRSRREQRNSSWLSIVWKTYYACWGNFEQAQWTRASNWLRDNRRHGYRPVFLEFVPWVQTRWSISIASFVIGWLFMAPMVVYFVLIHRVPPTECPRRRKIYASIALALVSGPEVYKTVRRANASQKVQRVSYGSIDFLCPFSNLPAL